MTVNCVFVDLLDLHFGFFIVYLVAAGFCKVFSEYVLELYILY